MSRLARHAVLNAAGNAFVPLSGAATAPLLASILGPSGRGEVAAATTPLLLALTVAGLGLPEAATYFMAKGRLRARATLALWIGVLFGSAAGAFAIWFSAPYLSGDNSELASVMLTCSALLPICLAVGVVRGVAAGQQRWIAVNLERFITALTRLCGILVLIGSDGLDVASASLTIVASQALGGCAYFLLLARRNSHIVQQRRTRSYSQVYKYSFGVWFGALAGVILLRLDQLLMLPLSDSYQLGLYAVAVNVAELMLIGANSIRDVVFSAESADPKVDRIAFASRIAFYATLLLSLTTYILCIAFLPTVFGRDFAASSHLFGIMAVGFALGAPGSISGAFLSSRNRPYLRSVSLTIAALANIGLVFLMVPSLGAYGAAIATSICAALSGGLNQFFCSRSFGVSTLQTYSLGRRDIIWVLNLTRGFKEKYA